MPDSGLQGKLLLVSDFLTVSPLTVSGCLQSDSLFIPDPDASEIAHEGWRLSPPRKYCSAQDYQ